MLIAGKTGRIHHATQHPGLRKTQPCYCFVSEEFFQENAFDKARYLASRWPSINCSANPNGIGSHVLPDPEKTVTIPNNCPIFREFMRQIEQIAAVKSITAA